KTKGGFPTKWRRFSTRGRRFRASKRTYWPRVGPEMARMQGRGPKRLSLIESLRPENAADGPFPAQPEGTPGLWASYVVAPPQRLVRLESLRRPASSEAPKARVAGPI